MAIQKNKMHFFTDAILQLMEVFSVGLLFASFQEFSHKRLTYLTLKIVDLKLNLIRLELAELLHGSSFRSLTHLPSKIAFTVLIGVKMR